MSSTHWLKILIPLLMVFVLAITPQAVNLSISLAIIPRARELGSPVSELKNLSAVLQMEPWRVKIWEELGAAEFYAGEWKTAIITYEKAQEYGSLATQSEFNLARAYEEVGEYSNAILHYQFVLANGLQSEEIFERLVHLQREQNDLVGAVETLRSWTGFQVNRGDVFYSLGSLLCLSQPEQARGYLEQATAIDSTLSENVSYLVKALNEIDFEDDPAYQKVVIGRALGNTDQWDLALIALEEATRLNPEYGEAWAFFGEAQQRTGVSGCKSLETALGLSPESTVVRSLMAVYWRRNSDPEKALEYLNAIHEEDPDEAVWLLEIGYTTAEAGDIPLAMDYIQQAVALEPNNSLYQRSLAMFCSQNQIEVYTIGLPAARQALLLAPKDPLALDTMGWLLFSQGDDRTAHRFYAQALQYDADNPLIHYHFSLLYLQREDYSKALEHLQLSRRYAKADSEIGLLAERILKQYFSGESVQITP